MAMVSDAHHVADLGTQIALSPAQDIRTIVDLVQRLTASVNQSAPVTIDATALETGDLTLVQAVIAAWQSSRSLGLAFHIQDGGALARLMSRCGLDDDTLTSILSAKDEALHEQDDPVRR